jgi:hypothetical protein
MQNALHMENGKNKHQFYFVKELLQSPTQTGDFHHERFEFDSRS